MWRCTLELVENGYKYVTIQIGWDVKRITIQLGGGVYLNVSLKWNWLSLEKFTWYIILI